MQIELDTVTYAPHSMMHKALIKMEPTKLELLDGYEQVDAGHIYEPEKSNVRVIISGRNWAKKRFLIYGSTSTEGAEEYVQQILKDLEEIGHEATVTQKPEITNLTVSGDFGVPLSLESLAPNLGHEGVDAEYEPEQFPAIIVKLDQPKSTFMLYSTGKFVIQGLTEPGDIDTAVEEMVNRLNDLNN